MLATLSERGDAHTQQHLQRWRMDDIWLDREPGEREMVPRLRALAAAGALMLAVSDGETAFAEKSGGILKIGQFDSPAGMSILEESSNTAEGPMMGVFNNLVLYDQHEPQNSLQSIRPDPRHRVVVGRGPDAADLSLASRRQMARWQAVHRRRCQMHLGPT